MLSDEGGDVVRTRLSVCARKARFSSEEDALLAAGHVGLPLLPYRCDRCRRFHLTSRTKGKRVPTRMPVNPSPRADG
jgi:hypothetical protein